MKKQLSLVTLALIVTACSGGGIDPVAFGGKASISVATDTSKVDPSGTGVTNVTFTSATGSLGGDVSTATLRLPGSTTSEPVTVALTSKTVPSGFTCGAASGLNVAASCSLNDSGTAPGQRVVTYQFSNSELFGKALSTYPAAQNFELTFGGKVANSNATWTSNTVPITVGAATSAPGTPAAPRPTFAILNSAQNQPYSNILSVSVSANLSAGDEIQKLVLEVTDNRGLTDTESFTAASGSANFSIDTTKYPDGNLTLRAVALTKSGATGTSASQTVQIRNLVPPSFQIIKPTLNQVVATTLDAQVQLTKQNSDFTITGTQGAGTTTLNVRDYRGNVLLTAPATLRETSPGSGIWSASASFDMNGKLVPNNAYTLEAVTKIKLDAETSERIITQSTPFTSQNSNLRPPSLLLHLPTFFGDTGTGIPVINRDSGAFVQASDDDGVKQLQLQFVCKDVASTCGDSGSYAYNYPVDAKGVIPLFVHIGQAIDAQPFVKDGNYTLRATVTDGSNNTTIQEVPVRVSRAANDALVGGLTTMRTLVYPNPVSKEPNPKAAVWYIGDPAVCDTPPEGEPVDTDTCVPVTTPSTNPVRVLTAVYKKTTEQFGVSSPTEMSVRYLPAGARLASALTFSEAGVYQISFLVEDMVTGVVKHYSGGVVNVKINP
ncbi:hypothetical protein [Deinococcus pimensis]|uniref:hypothetical protein n=1 Tax=Deinococcus pimensis TaxID=309888 RepID=UPI00047FB0D2|nr:hypothetical protein [Deinococcus pimensis]